MDHLVRHSLIGERQHPLENHDLEDPSHNPRSPSLGMGVRLVHLSPFPMGIRVGLTRRNPHDLQTQKLRRKPKTTAPTAVIHARRRAEQAAPIGQLDMSAAELFLAQLT